MFYIITIFYKHIQRKSSINNQTHASINTVGRNYLLVGAIRACHIFRLNIYLPQNIVHVTK